MTLPVIAVVGYSDSGKTRVVSALVRVLSQQGHRVAAVKHCHEGHQMDTPEKDTAKLFAAGAETVIASSPGQITSIERVEGDTPLEEIVASLDSRDSSYDLVVAEGFKGSSVPKVLVLGEEPVVPRPSNVIAEVSDTGESGDVPCYTFDQSQSLAEQIEQTFLRRVAAP